MKTEEKRLELIPTVSPIKRLWHLLIDILLFIALFFVILFLISIPLVLLFDSSALKDVRNIPILILNEALMLISVFLAAWIVFTIRKVPLAKLGLSLKGRLKDLLAGMLFALVLYGIGFGVSLLLGVVEVTEVSFHPWFLLLSFIFFLLVGIAEELMVRGFILGRMIDGGVNKFLALVISSIIFSLMHLLNPEFAFLPFLNLVLAGILLGASYLYTRNLCFPIVLHWFWNWLQGPVLGYEVSGNDFGDGLFSLRLSGDSLLNGGAFGFEGSIICSALMIIGTWLIIRYSTFASSRSVVNKASVNK